MNRRCASPEGRHGIITATATMIIGYFCPTPQKGKIRGTSDRLVALRDRVSGAEAELP
jgi:hypothetical protein